MRVGQPDLELVVRERATQVAGRARYGSTPPAPSYGSSAGGSARSRAAMISLAATVKPIASYARARFSGRARRRSSAHVQALSTDGP